MPPTKLPLARRGTTQALARCASRCPFGSRDQPASKSELDRNGSRELRAGGWGGGGGRRREICFVRRPSCCLGRWRRRIERGTWHEYPWAADGVDRVIGSWPPRRGAPFFASSANLVVEAVGLRGGGGGGGGGKGEGLKLLQAGVWPRATWPSKDNKAPG